MNVEVWYNPKTDSIFMVIQGEAFDMVATSDNGFEFFMKDGVKKLSDAIRLGDL